MYNKLFDSLSHNKEFTSEDIDLTNEYFEFVTTRKNTLLEEAGNIPQYLYYIISGFLRLFYYDDNGNEITIHINCPHGFFTPFNHFSNQTNSDLNLESITDCELLRISKQKYDNLMQRSLAWRDYGWTVLEESMSYNDSRAKDLATLNAEERYIKLMKTHPELIQNVPLQYIASFLGMKPESLSRIRRNIIT